MPEVTVPRDHGPDVRDIPDHRPWVVHQLGLVHLADHDGMGNPAPPKEPAPCADPEQANAPEALAHGRKDGVVLVREPKAVDRVTLRAESLCDDDRQATS